MARRKRLKKEAKKDTKKDPKNEEEESSEEQEETGDDLGDIEETLKSLNLSDKDKEEYLDEVKERLAKGESLDDIKKEIEKDLAETEEEEDFVTKSKYEKTVKNMEKRIAKLTSQIKAQEVKESKKDLSDDDKLNKMSLDELQSVKKQVRRSMRRESDDEKLDQLEDLADKIETKIGNQPKDSFKDK